MAARIFFVLAPAVLAATLLSVVHPFAGLAVGICVAGLGWQVTARAAREGA